MPSPFRYRAGWKPWHPILAGMLAIGLFMLAGRAYNYATLWLVGTRSDLAFLPFMLLVFAIFPLLAALFAWAAKKSGPKRKSAVIGAATGCLVLLYLIALWFQIEPLIDLFPHMPGSHPQFSLWRILAFLGTALVFILLAELFSEPPSVHFPRRHGPSATVNPGWEPGGSSEADVDADF